MLHVGSTAPRPPTRDARVHFLGDGYDKIVHTCDNAQQASNAMHAMKCPHRGTLHCSLADRAA